MIFIVTKQGKFLDEFYPSLLLFTSNSFLTPNISRVLFHEKQKRRNQPSYSNGNESVLLHFVAKSTQVLLFCVSFIPASHVGSLEPDLESLTHRA
ncbi:hypothetical protein TNIN_77141 [Trichonephila inaurata madagascariensis]|uniref:Uncharacterized protein n=1 Tax=Trichonephila inaurata madagascariensis TaxID=2747483 RepID=A0A8X6YC02_9ARAC|nr:hypothetical protein TNIN_77141 [Trichonephila inaurata madagascariensis]